MVKLKNLRKAQELLLKFRVSLEYAEDVFDVNKAIGYMCKLHVVYDESKRTIKNKQLFKDLDNMEKKVDLSLNTKGLDLTEIKEIGIDFEKE